MTQSKTNMQKNLYLLEGYGWGLPRLLGLLGARSLDQTRNAITLCKEKTRPQVHQGRGQAVITSMLFPATRSHNKELFMLAQVHKKKINAIAYAPAPSQ